MPPRLPQPDPALFVRSASARRTGMLVLVTSPANTDAQFIDALEGVDVGLPPGLTISWLGVSGYVLTFEGTSIFIDPYVSRVPLRSLLLRRSDARRSDDRPLRQRSRVCRRGPRRPHPFRSC